MAFGSCLGVALILSAWTTISCDYIADGVHMACRDRHFMIAVDLSLAGNEARFEAVDKTGTYAITESYAAQCGYSFGVFPPLNRLELRASYFSCHTARRDDKVFTFNFKLIVNHEGKEATYALNKTCSPSVPWSHRELICEANYMEVSMRSEMTCPSGATKDDWNAATQTAYSSATSDWQVMFQRVALGLTPMNISEAQKQGYMFDWTHGRLVFRTPYGQPHSLSTVVNGVPVEVVQATLFSKQSWVVLMIDMLTACSISEGSFDDNGYMTWETPEVQCPLVPGVNDTVVRIGGNGKLVEQGVAEERGYKVEKSNATVHISIPLTGEGVYRKSIVSENLYYEYYIFHLYVELVSVDGDHSDTRYCYHRILGSPLLPCPVFTEDRTHLKDHAFTVYLGNVPDDAKLVAVHVNGQLLSNASSHTITEVAMANNTYGYTLKIPFNNPVVMQQLFKEDSILQYTLDINYTLSVYPENDLYYHTASVIASVDVSPPAFDAVCSESGITFMLEPLNFNCPWQISIGPDRLTPALAAQHGYTMSNDSQSLVLSVPLFTHGYEYKDITLTGFSATFELLASYRGSSEVHAATAKTCRFDSTELIVCSTDGRMTVVADLSESGMMPEKTHLRDKFCTPTESDDTRALFNFPLNSCGSVIKLRKDHVTYENEIFYSRHIPLTPDSSSYGRRVILQCTYALSGLHRLFSVYKFESDTVGVGRIIHSARSTNGLQSPTAEPTTVPATRRTTRRPSVYPPVQYIKVASFLKHLSKKGAQRPLPIQVNAAAY